MTNAVAALLPQNDGGDLARRRAVGAGEKRDVAARQVLVIDEAELLQCPRIGDYRVVEAAQSSPLSPSLRSSLVVCIVVLPSMWRLHKGRRCGRSRRCRRCVVVGVVIQLGRPAAMAREISSCFWFGIYMMKK